MSDYPPTVPPATPPPPGGGSYTPQPPPPPPPGGGYTPPGPTSGGAGDRTLWLILSYFGIFSLIPLFAKKDDAEVQWHAKNGTALMLAEFIVLVALTIISMMVGTGSIGCGIGAVIGVLQCLIIVGIIVVSVYCMVQAVNGKRPRLPVITDLADKF